MYNTFFSDNVSYPGDTGPSLLGRAFSVTGERWRYILSQRSQGGKAGMAAVVGAGIVTRDGVGGRSGEARVDG